MGRVLLIFVALTLSGCAGSGAATQVSEANPYSPQGMTYDQFRKHAGGGDDDMSKRFVTLDRDNNGRLSPEEMGGL